MPKCGTVGSDLTSFEIVFLEKTKTLCPNVIPSHDRYLLDLQKMYLAFSVKTSTFCSEVQMCENSSEMQSIK